MSSSNPRAFGEPVLGVPADDFHEFVDHAVNCAKPGEISGGALSQPILSVEVSDFEEFFGQAVISPEELSLLGRHKPDSSGH